MGNAHSISWFMIFACGFAAASGDWRDRDTRALKWVVTAEMIISGTATRMMFQRAKSSAAPGSTKAWNCSTGCEMNDDSGAPNRRASRKLWTSSALNT